MKAFCCYLAKLEKFLLPKLIMSELNPKVFSIKNFCCLQYKMSCIACFDLSQLMSRGSSNPFYIRDLLAGD